MSEAAGLVVDIKATAPGLLRWRAVSGVPRWREKLDILEVSSSHLRFLYTAETEKSLVK